MEVTAETRRIAELMMQFMPFMMRVWAAEVRAASDNPAPGHLGILGMLRYRSHTLSELAERHAVTSPTMSNTINVLEERGWVARRRSTDDRRVVWIELTETGQAELERINEQVVNRIAALLAQVPPEDQQRMLDGIGILHDVFVSAVERDPALQND